MAWNEPGNNGNDNDKDPWGGGRKGGDQGPPDIDEVVRNLTKKFNSLFGGGQWLRFYWVFLQRRRWLVCGTNRRPRGRRGRGLGIYGCLYCRCGGTGCGVALR